MAVTPHDQSIALTPLQEAVAKGIENQIDLFILQHWDRTSRIDWRIGQATTPKAIVDYLIRQYRIEGHWPHVRSYVKNDVTYLALSEQPLREFEEDG